jgi:hypothetical protein
MFTLYTSWHNPLSYSGWIKKSKQIKTATHT